MQYLTYPLLAARLTERGVPMAEGTLRKMVSQKRIPFVKLSKRVVFDVDRNDSWISARAVEPAAAR